MAMTATERVRAVRERRRRRKIQVTVVLHQDDLREIARRGYEGAASTDRARQRCSLLIRPPVYWSRNCQWRGRRRAREPINHRPSSSR